MIEDLSKALQAYLENAKNTEQACLDIAQLFNQKVRDESDRTAALTEQYEALGRAKVLSDLSQKFHSEVDPYEVMDWIVQEFYRSVDKALFYESIAKC